MKERPILFQSDMVRALLDGRKTQTRRIVKPQPEATHGKPVDHFKHCDQWRDDGGFWAPQSASGVIGAWQPDSYRCPYGQPGDLLYVREAWALLNNDGWAVTPSELHFKADSKLRLVDPDELKPHKQRPRPGWRPSIHMPRWASRLTLRILNLRAERIQDIGWFEALSEGVRVPVTPEGRPLVDLTSKFAAANYLPKGWSKMPSDEIEPMLIKAYFASLWDSVNDAGAWDRNDWVWVIEFEVLNENVDQVLAA